MTASTDIKLDDAAILDLFERLALDAGRAIMEVYDNGFEAALKTDESPVTPADNAAEAVILAGLREALPDIPVVAEEEAAAGRLPQLDGDFILVDPLDGTKEFIARRGDFTVNIALVRDGIPTVGVVYAPAKGQLYSGMPGGATVAAVDAGYTVTAREPMEVAPVGETMRVVASLSHRTPETDDFIAKYEGAKTVNIGSSLKFCLLASGEADIYPRFGPTMEWDTAAGDAVLRAAGGHVRCLDGEPLRYGKRNRADMKDFLNPFFIAEATAAAS